MLKYLKFVVSRAIGTGVDTLVLWLLSAYIFDGGYFATYIISPIISFEAAAMSNFICSYYWIWRGRITTRNRRSFWRHFFGFNLASTASFIVKMLFLLLFERWFGLSVVVCNLLALCISGALNFLLSERVVFRKSTPPPIHTLLTAEEIANFSPLLRGELGKLFARFAMWICGIGRLNRLYDSVHHLEGPAAARKALQQIGCDYLVGNAERLFTLPDGPFITISNHPYGAIDGLITLDMIGRYRKDAKIIVNKILGRVEPLQSSFIAVTPTETKHKQADATTLQGVRACMAHLRNGHPLCLFPAGAVSDLHPRQGVICDREWQEGVIKLIEWAKVPVVPIHFEGRNTMFYYILGLISWKLRLLRLPRELLNKHRGVHQVTIGCPISVGEQHSATSSGTLKEMLRRAVYDMPSPQEYTPSSTLIRH